VGDIYGKLDFASSSGIYLQKLHMKFAFEPNVYNFMYRNNKLDLHWSIQHFDH
jgi:hypothetical protein